MPGVNKAYDVSRCWHHHNLLNDPEITLLNLDVTTMMAYVSNLTNGYCDYAFKQDVLTEQAVWESINSVKRLLDKLFIGRSLICCQTAWKDFERIVNAVAGPKEKFRVAQLKNIMNIYPDDFGGENDDRREHLKIDANIRQNPKVIFNFGHRMDALTVTSNENFVQAALEQGIPYEVFIHQPRVLSEYRQNTAEKLSPTKFYFNRLRYFSPFTIM